MTKCSSCGTELVEGNPCSTCDATIASDDLATHTVATAAPPSPSTPRRTPSSLSRVGHFAPTKDARFVPGSLVADRYRIVALLGKGGMGEVYRAEDLTLGQQVALKFLPESLVRNEDALRRFYNEVLIARKVSHPNVCRVYDVGEVDEYLFLSMEYVDGEDLGSLLRRIGRLPADKALEISRKLCAGLAAAHDKGVLHRDLKPANVMLDGRGQVLLTDFGLAALEERIVGADVRSGTPAYMAPEQLAGKEVTVQSDIYSLGLVIYELFSGKRPFEGDSLADLTRARNETTPVSLTSLVGELDPAVERVILRCLDPEPSRRPRSALAVSAALPGGDPLAAALAAGETPSPQMVAAAGEGTGLAPRFAIPVFVAVMIGIFVCSFLALRRSALERMQPEYPPQVLAHKVKEILQHVGYTARPYDSVYSFDWNYGFIGSIGNEKPFLGWNQILSERPSYLLFSYRQSPYPLTALSFHDDLLTPGMVTSDDPPTDLSGMINVSVDAQGRLTKFQAIPEQLQQTAKETPAPNWNALFDAAGLDPAQFQTTEPLWTWLATSDVRAAWTGAWPGSKRPLRVEAAALRGKPVAFQLIGSWTKPSRMPPPESTNRGSIRFMILIGIVLAVLVTSPILARRNLASGKGDRRGAFRLAAFIFWVQMALWLTRSHLTFSLATFGMFILALCTSLFYGLFLWTVYLGIEPYVRRHWPQTLISWTRVLSGQLRDPIVGRDVLFGVALGVSWSLIGQMANLWSDRTEQSLGLLPPELLLGVRSMLGIGLSIVPHAVREALIFFFMLFLLRVLLRNQWLAGAAFVVIWGAITILQNSSFLLAAIVGVAINVLLVVVVLRFGLLALAVGVVVSGLLSAAPTLHTDAWYFPNTTLVISAAVALGVWAFYAACGKDLRIQFQ